MDYESARITIKKLATCLEHDSCENMDCEYFTTFEDLKGLLEWLKTYSSPNVQCKDCRYQRNSKCLLWKAEIFDEFYCKNGEKPDGKPWGQ